MGIEIRKDLESRRTCRGYDKEKCGYTVYYYITNHEKGKRHRLCEKCFKKYRKRHNILTREEKRKKKKKEKKKREKKKKERRMRREERRRQEKFNKIFRKRIGKKKKRR